MRLHKILIAISDFLRAFSRCQTEMAARVETFGGLPEGDGPW